MRVSKGDVKIIEAIFAESVVALVACRVPLGPRVKRCPKHGPVMATRARQARPVLGSTVLGVVVPRARLGAMESTGVGH